MVAPLLGAALISGGSSLLGGLLGNRNNKKNIQAQNNFNQKQLDAQNEYNSPIEIRRRAEEGGFNPMSFVGPGVGLSPGLSQGSPQIDMMGDAVASAGLALSDGLGKQAQLNAYNSALEQQNTELRKALDRQILRPDVGVRPSVRPVPQNDPSENATFSAIPQVPSVADVAMIGDQDQGFAPRGTGNDAYPYRKPEVMTVKSLPVIADVELPGGETFPVLHDGDEIMGFEKFPAFGFGLFYDHFTEAGRTIRRKTDRAGITDPAKTYTPPVILDSMLPRRYDPSYWMTRPKKPVQSRYKPGAGRRTTGMEDLGF